VKFHQLLAAAIRRSEIPLRMEPGAQESVAAPVIEMLQNWIAAHIPEGSETEFDAGYRALAVQLLTELEGSAELPE
jgi:hypothetical protein